MGHILLHALIDRWALRSLAASMSSSSVIEERVPGEEAFMILGAARRSQPCLMQAKKIARDFDTLLAVSKTTN